LLEEFVKHYNIYASMVNFDDIDNLFSPPVRLGIYRIFQESFTNIGKHAKATQISASIKKMGQQVSFLIKDNGQGFNLEEILGQENRTKGIGLTTMMERARLAGGHLEINSRVGAGTEIAFMIPVRVEREAENDNL
jgi:signal transduction histidine kinase